MITGFTDNLAVLTALPNQRSPLARIERLEELSKVQIAWARVSLQLQSIEPLMQAVDSINPQYEIENVLAQANEADLTNWREMGLITARHPCPSHAVVLFTYSQLSLELANLSHRESELKRRKVEQVQRAPVVVVEQEMPVRPLRRSSSAPDLTAVSIPYRARSHSLPLFPDPRKKLEEARRQQHRIGEAIDRAERLIAILVKFDVVFWQRLGSEMRHEIRSVFDALPIEERKELQRVGLGVQKNRNGIFTYPTAAGITESLAQYQKELQVLEKAKAALENETRQLSRFMLTCPFPLDALKAK